MGTIRKIVGDQHTDPLNSATVINRPLEDVLSNSDYTTDGLNFGGFTQPNASKPQRFNQGPFYDATHPTFGARGDGTQDDRAALFACNAAVGQTGIMQLWPGNGFHVDSNLTIDCARLRGIPGAKLQPNTGVTITVNANIDECCDGMFDRSRGGTFDISQNKKIREVNPRVFGIVGDGIVDDAPAVNFMNNCVPDRMVVRFPKGTHMKWSSMVYNIGRAGVWWVGTLDPTDADLNSPNVTVTWAGPAGGYALGLYNSGYMHVVGFQFDMQNVGRAVDIDMFKCSTTLGSATISIDQQLGSVGAGPAFFTSIGPAGTTVPFRLSGGGVTNAALSGTLVVVDGTHATMTTNGVTPLLASVSNVNTLALSLGSNARVPVFRIATKCFFEYCQFSFNAAGQTVQFGIVNAYTSRANCEYVTVTRCQFAGNFQAQTFNGNGYGLAATGGSIASGTNHLSGFNNSPFTPSHNGLQLIIGGSGAAGAGARGGNGALNGFAKYISANQLDVYTDATLTTPLNAINSSDAPAYSNVTTYQPGTVVLSGGVTYRCIATTLGNAPPNNTYWATVSWPHFQLGQCFGTGFYNGTSQNAKGMRLIDCDFTNIHIGIDCEGGSLHHELSNFSNNDINVVMGVAQSEPSTDVRSNSEQCRQHLFGGSPCQYTMVLGTRLGMAATYPSDGFIKVVAGVGAPIKIVDSQLENPLPGNSAAFNGNGQSITIITENNKYADATSLAELGWDDTSLAAGGGGGTVYSKNDQTPNSSQLLYGNTQGGGERVFASAGIRTNGNPRSLRQGLQLFSNPYQPVQSDHVTFPSVAFYTQGNGGTGGAERIFASLLESNGTMFHTNLALEQGGAIQVTDGASIQLDPRVAKGFFLTTAQAAPNFLALPAGHWWYEMQEFFVMLQNGTAGAIAPTWGGGSTGFTGSWIVPTAGFPYPAPGKIRTYLFAMHNGFPYVKLWSPADAG